MKVVALIPKLDNGINNLILSFLGTTPRKVHPIAEMVKPCIKVMVAEYGTEILDINEWNEYEHGEDDEYDSFSACLLFELRVRLKFKRDYGYDYPPFHEMCANQCLSDESEDEERSP